MGKNGLTLAGAPLILTGCITQSWTLTPTVDMFSGRGAFGFRSTDIRVVLPRPLKRADRTQAKTSFAAMTLT